MTFLYREYVAYANFLEAWAQADELAERETAAAGNRYAAYSARAKAAEVAYAYHIIIISVALFSGLFNKWIFCFD